MKMNIKTWFFVLVTMTWWSLLRAQVTDISLGMDGINIVEVTQDRSIVNPYYTELHPDYTENVTVPYRLFLPYDFDPTKKYPLIISMHGNGSMGTNNLENIAGLTASLCYPQIQAEYPSIIIFPHANGDWHNLDHSESPFYRPASPWGHAAMFLMERYSEKVFVDRTRIYVMGSSKGGGGTWSIAKYGNNHETIAAIVPNQGSTTTHDLEKLQELPTWAQIGAPGNLFFNENINAYNFFAAQNGDPLYTAETMPPAQTADPLERYDLITNNGLFTLSYYPNKGHDVTYTDSLDLINWLFAQTNTNVLDPVSANTLPVSAGTPLVLEDALPLFEIRDDLNHYVTDADYDPLFFRQLDGPDWLTIDETGKMLGTPTAGEIGANVWTVEAWDGRGDPVQTSLVINVIADTIPPAAPENLVAVAGDTQISLVWDANHEPDFAGYRVYRSEAPGGPFTLIATIPVNTFYIDDDVINGQAYYYIITASDVAGNISSDSVEVSAVPLPAGDIIPRVYVKESFNYTPGVDSLPGNVPPEGSGLTGSWSGSGTDIVSGTIGAPADYGIIPSGHHMNELSDGLEQPRISLADDVRFDFRENKVFYISYLFRHNLGWTKSYFQLLEGTTPVVSLGYGFNRLRLEAGATNRSGPTLPVDTDVLIIARIDTRTAGPDQISASFFTSVIGTEPTTWQVTLSEEISNVIDTIGFDSSTGSGNYIKVDELHIGSTFESVIRPLDGPPSTPRGLTAIPGDTSVTLNWTDNPETDLDSYVIYRSTTSGDYGDPLEVDVPDSVFTDNTVTNGTLYFYRVLAVNSKGLQSEASDEVFVFPASDDDYPPVFIPEPIVMENAFQDQAFSNTLTTWLFDSDSTIHLYFMVSGPSWLTVERDGTIWGTPGAAHIGLNSFRVQVFGPGGDYESEMYIDVIGVPPAVPAGLAASAGDGSVLLTWTAAEGGGTVSYELYRSEVLGDYGSPIETGLTGTSFEDLTVANGTTYHYALVAVGSSGLRSDFSGQVSATPEVIVDITPPAPPTGLSATLSGGTVTLHWVANTEDDFSSYRIYRRGESEAYGTAEAVDLESNSYLDTTVIAETRYYYSVTAVDTSENESGFSAEVFVDVTDSEVVARYTFDAQTLVSDDDSPGSTAGDIVHGGGLGTFPRYETREASGPTVPALAWKAFDFNDTTLLDDDYIAFTITPEPGVELAYESLSFIHRFGGNNGSDVVVFSSQGGFTAGSEIGTIQLRVRNEPTLFTVDLSGLEPTGEPVEFRLYFTTTATFDVDAFIDEITVTAASRMTSDDSNGNGIPDVWESANVDPESDGIHEPGSGVPYYFLYLSGWELGQEPGEAGRIQIVPETGGSGPVFSWTFRSEFLHGTHFKVYVSTDLLSWEEFPGEAFEIQSTDIEGTERTLHELTLTSAPGDKLFLRLQNP